MIASHLEDWSLDTSDVLFIDSPRRSSLAGRDRRLRLVLDNHMQAGPSATRVYDWHTYYAEKRAALERWSSRPTTILEKKKKGA